jgi:hypothetical protein
MENYIASIVAAILGYISSRYANRKSKGVLPTVGIVSILIVIAAGLTFIGHWITKPPPAPPNKLEGQWVEKYKEDENDIYAIAKFRYNSEAKYLEFSGDAYDKSITFVGHWQTKQALLDGNQYDYLFTGESSNTDPTKPRIYRKGQGEIWFTDNSMQGQGRFFSMGSDRTPRDFSLYKILDEDAAKESMNHPEEFINKVYADPNYLKKVAPTH